MYMFGCRLCIHTCILPEREREGHKEGHRARERGREERESGRERERGLIGICEQVRKQTAVQLDQESARENVPMSTATPPQWTNSCYVRSLL